jgi:hypothetical protein
MNVLSIDEWENNIKMGLIEIFVRGYGLHLEALWLGLVATSCEPKKHKNM